MRLSRLIVDRFVDARHRIRGGRARFPRRRRGTPRLLRRMELLEERTLLAFSIAGIMVNEDVGSATATVTLSATMPQEVSVALSTSRGSAFDGSDYVETSQTVVIPAGETSATVDITILNDAFPESEEQFFLVLSNPFGAGIDIGEAIATIVDDDASIRGSKWEDVNGDGMFDANESLLEGVTIYLDANNNGNLDAGELTDITDASGAYEFTGLLPGAYVVREVVPDGVEQTFPRSVGPLPSVLEALNTNFTAVNSLIPNRFDFSEGVTGDRISDGGNDMYDSGNFLNTNLAAAIDYTGGVVTNGDGLFGAGSSYFTRKHPGLFVMSAQNIDITEFQITGGAGDGAGTADGAVIQLNDGYTAFVKRIYGASEPSVNHVILVPGDGSGQNQTFSTDTNSDQHLVTGLAGLREIHYLLFASVSGGFINDGSLQAIADAFVEGSGLGDEAHYQTLTSGQTVTGLNFGNREILAGEIQGTKWSDLDQDGRRDVGEPGVAGWTIFLDTNGDGGLDGGEPIAQTGANGQYSFADLSPGNYRVTELRRAGWEQTFPASGAWRVTIGNGEQVTGIDFGNHELQVGSISGTKWHDTNGNGMFDFGESLVAGATIYLDANDSGSLDDGELTALTDANGAYLFSGLVPGSYRVREIVPNGFEQTFPSAAVAEGAHLVALASGQDVGGLDFGNREILVGGISGTKWSDLDQDGRRDVGEPSVSGWIIFLDTNGDGDLDGGESSTLTDTDGNYSFTGLTPGDYVVAEIGRAGWEQTFPASDAWQVTVGNDELVTGVNFGNHELQPGVISGTKWTDLNQDGRRDAGDSGVAGWTIFLDTDGDGDLDGGEPNTLTDADGNYSFAGLTPGDYIVAELQQPGWQQTFPASGEWQVTVNSGGQVTDVNFGNHELQPGTISGVKWNDIDADGERGAGESPVAGVTVYLDANNNGSLDAGEITSITDASGVYEFTGLFPANYIVREVVPDGFEQTFPLSAGPLSQVLDELNANFTAVNSLIPNRFDFSDGISGSSIADGGNDMYDGGNSLNTNLASSIGYTGGVVTNGDGLFGAGSSYFTSKYAGLFVMSAQNIDITDFQITGNNGADGGGTADGAVIPLRSGDTAFVKRVYGTSDPSINHIILVPGDGSAQSQSFASSTNSDQHQVSGLEGVRELHYLLVASTNGGFIDNEQIQAIAEAFIETVGFGGDGHFQRLQSGQRVTALDFGNREILPGEIRGTKWSDLNQNGHRDPVEPGLAGRTIYLDLNLNDNLDSDEPTAVTDGNGDYAFSGLTYGGYLVAELPQSGWRQTSPVGGSWEVEVGNGEIVTGVDFGNHELQPGSISGTKWDDANGNGVFDAGESPLAGVTIFLDSNSDNRLGSGEASDVTDANGFYEFTGLALGKYAVRQVVPRGSAQTFPIPNSRPSLPQLLANLNSNFASINSLIPNRFDFIDGTTGTVISDGGNDMFNTGNRLTTDISPSAISYTGGIVTDSAAEFGFGSTYFTQKYPGLFVLSATNVSANHFRIEGSTGTNGEGNVDGFVVPLASGYTAFVKRVFGTSDPSVNHIILTLGTGAGQSQSFPTVTTSDQHSVTSVPDFAELHYLLFASGNGGFVTDEEIKEIAEAYIEAAGLTPEEHFLEISSGQQATGLNFGSRVDPATTLRLTGSGQVFAFTSISAPNLRGIGLVDITGSGSNKLILDAGVVADISPTRNELLVIAGSDDIVEIGSGWSLTGTLFERGVHYRVLEQAGVKLFLSGPHQWQNPVNRRDVDNDGSVTPIDALISINELHQRRFSDGRGSAYDPALLATDGNSNNDFDNLYRDVNGDGFFTTVDALQVINFLNRRLTNPPAEGASTVPLLVAQGGELSVAAALRSAAQPASISALSSDEPTWTLAPRERIVNTSTQRNYAVAVDKFLASEELVDLRLDALAE